MNFDLREISNALDCWTVLAQLGIAHVQGRRFPCPLHVGSGQNFSVSSDGKLFRCWSHDCGDGFPKDAINLYCWAKFRQALPLLDRDRKRSAIEELAGIAGIEPTRGRGPRSKARRNSRGPLPVREAKLLAEIMADTSLLNCGVADLEMTDSAGVTSENFRTAIKFLCISRAMGQLPSRVDATWPLMAALDEEVARAKVV